MSEIQQLQDECNMGVGAEDTSILSDNPNLAAGIKTILELQLQAMVIPIVQRIVGPMMEHMVRRVVKEELERVQERLFTKEKRKSGDAGHITHMRQLELQFLEKVCVPVYTGKEIKGEGGNHLTVALIDPLTGSPVDSGPEASEKVQIIALAKADEDVDSNFKHEESQDTGRPVLSRNHVMLKEGIAVLDKFKFKNKAKWTKGCKVNLVARIANLNGITVKEAATEEFLVMDCRSTLYKKHYPPSLSDEVWRLEKISRGSRLQKRLKDANINTVEEFLRLLNMNPQSLRAILNISPEKFKVIADHAHTCLIGEKLYLYNSTSCERKAGVIFNIVGSLRGLLYEDKYVTVEKLSEDEKVDAHKIIVSAFEHLDDAEFIENEASIAHFISCFSYADGANTPSSPRTETAAHSTSGIWNMNGESDDALQSMVPRHLSPVYSFGPGFLDTFDLVATDNMDILSQGIDYPILSRSGSEDFTQQLQFFIEPHSDANTTASDNQITGTAVAPSSLARRRWRMAIRIVALGDIQARKRQRLH